MEPKVCVLKRELVESLDLLMLWMVCESVRLGKMAVSAQFKAFIISR